ncbi:ATP-dependent RNA helicase DDX54-like [Astatotilapia calliptera]|uniref:ATP-dependent RNA helicase DDX54-like n=1 Tax=Astatotilapia calliptera TaxID=8154 RepID=UPI000E415F4E|nr:ATP-dependent RNA helicase DDX54-like [Astatotilapia calliptera]
MLFIDYSSAFNTIIPSKLAAELVDLGLETPICRWILNFLTNRPQVVKVGKHTSSPLILNTGTPQGCVLSPPPIFPDCVAKHESNIIIKFADDTTIISLITGNDETAYREEVMALYEWCLENNLTLNISKTREMIVDYRKRPVREHQPSHINDTAIRKARQRLYFLRRLRKFGMNANITSNFYRCAIESLLTSCITVCDTRLVDKFSKQREDRAAESRLQQPTNPTTTADCDITEKVESDLKGVFSEVVGGKRRGQQEDGEERPKTKKKRQSGKDEEYYIPYRPKDFDSERGLSLGGEGSAFEQQASSAVLDLMGDEGDRLNQQKKMMKWDRKRKHFVRETGKEDQKKKIKTDSGQVISNKKNRKNFYEEWKKKYKIDDTGSGSDGETGGGGRKPARGRGRGRRGPNVQSSGDHKARSELKTKDQIMKQRKKKQKHQFLQGGGMRKLRSKNKKWLGEVKKSGFGRGGHKKGKLRKKL